MNSIETLPSPPEVAGGLLTLLTPEPLLLSACDGGYISLKKMITSIDQDYESWGLDRDEDPCPETYFAVYEMVPGKNSTFHELFLSFDYSLRELTFSQRQIYRFSKEFSHLIKNNGRATFFLLPGEKFVAALFSSPSTKGYPEISFSEFESDCVWDASYRRQVVIPVQ